MAYTFTELLNSCSIALGDISGTVFDREDKIWPWCIEALTTFPIPRPMFVDYTVLITDDHGFDLPADFRDIISVEYPVSQTPPHYLLRKNRLDPDFYKQDGFYDVDHNYADGVGWRLYTSDNVRAPSHVYVQYLANHLTHLHDNSTDVITVPDEFVSIIISFVICRAYRERLGWTMQNPSSTAAIITQFSTLVEKMDHHYNEQVAAAQARLAQGKVGTHLTVDKYDRVY
jgi:hypothetical protein